MSKKDFDNFLKNHNSDPTKKGIDWTARKNEWLKFIDEFYKSVEGWLEPYIKKNKIKYEYRSIELTEDYIGVYEVRSLVISLANQQIKLKPIGTLLLGTQGRIDMEGARGRVTFILADKDSRGVKFGFSISENKKSPSKNTEAQPPDWTWKIVLREQRRIAYDEFNEENFFGAMMEIVNG